MTRTRPEWPLAIDPEGCGCTECIIGEYVPLEQVTSTEVARLLLGTIGNHTHLTNRQIRVDYLTRPAQQE